jgi:predicted house-cleaning noncanonical NTP pyrophosphatase (MazG superfamily)
MNKSIKFFSILCGVALISASAEAAERSNKKVTNPSTRRDAVIFKVHNIEPISEDGIVTGCDFDVTLYNRTSINFRNFTLNMAWNDKVEEKFKFNSYMEKFLTKEELAQQKNLIENAADIKPLQSSITVNAFGADKQISVHSHVNSEKCYLMLSNASFSVTPCDIVRNVDMPNIGNNFDNKECTALFQFVDTSNPEYFGQFKKLSATELEEQNQKLEEKELTDIDSVIDKIVDNLGTSDKTLTDIN